MLAVNMPVHTVPRVWPLVEMQSSSEANGQATGWRQGSQSILMGHGSCCRPLLLLNHCIENKYRYDLPQKPRSSAKCCLSARRSRDPLRSLRSVLPSQKWLPSVRKCFAPLQSLRHRCCCALTLAGWQRPGHCADLHNEEGGLLTVQQYARQQLNRQVKRRRQRISQDHSSIGPFGAILPC